MIIFKIKLTKKNGKERRKWQQNEIVYIVSVSFQSGSLCKMSKKFNIDGSQICLYVSFFSHLKKVKK